MKNYLYSFLIIIALAVTACSEAYDDSILREEIENLEDRVSALEQWQNEVNSDIASLQSIVNSLNGNDYITSIEDLTDSSGKVIGYRIHFAKSGSKDIYHGKDGAQGHTPAVGVRADSDGCYYWTLDGNWLLDDDGNKIKAAGKDGEDGITPKLKIEGNEWFVSYDNGASWSSLRLTTSGDHVAGSSSCLFQRITVSDTYITFYLADGTTFALPYGDELSISFSGTDSYVLSPDSTTEIGYEIKSSTPDVEVEVIASGDIFAEVVADDASKLKGKIRITTGPSLASQSKVVVLVTNGCKIIMRSLVFEKETLEISDNAEKVIPSSGGSFSIEFLSNLEYDVIISDDAASWLKMTGTRSVTENVLWFMADDNQGGLRSGTITVQSRYSSQKLVYTVTQEGADTMILPADIGVMPAGTLTSEYVPDDPEKGLAKIVDDDHSTSYEISGYGSASFIWHGDEKVSIKEISLNFGSDAGKRPGRFDIYVSENGISWVKVWGDDTRPDVVGVSMGFPAQMRCIYVKLTLQRADEASAIALAEWHLIPLDLGDFSTFDQVVASGTSFTHSDSTPMGNHYANKHVTTDEDKVWLSTATNEPALLPSTPGYTWREYPVNLYPFGDPIPADVNQHGVGDCSALAVFAEMAYLFPDFIKSIIKDHGDGTYTVNMFDPQGKPVQVGLQSTFLGDNNGIGAVSGKKGEATWATILEKAIIKWNNIYKVNPDIWGIGSEHVAPLFTGNGDSFGFAPDMLSGSYLQKAVERSLEERMIVIGGFNIGGLPVGPYQTVTAHAYSFMYSNNPDALFSMRNPWGYSPGSDGTEDGILDIMDDDLIPKTIDLRIIYPGIAKEYARETLTPYIPPVF